MDAEVCRVCFQAGEYDLFTDILETMDDGNMILSIVLENFTMLEISQDDPHPKKICSSCANDLCQAYQFVLKVKCSDKRLVEIMQEESEKALTFAEESESGDAVEPPLEELNAEIDLSDNESVASACSETKMTKKTPNIQLTKQVSTMLHKAGVPNKITELNRLKRKQSTQSRDVNAKRLKSDSVKRNEFIVVPHMTFSADKSASLEDCDNNLSMLDGGEDYLGQTSDGTRTRKTLNIEAVELTDAFNFESHSIEHLRDENNSDDEIYACKYCPKAFSSKFHLVVHTRKSHLCQFCLKVFRKPPELHQHVKETHNKFDCNICTKSFINNGNLRTHLRNTHQIKLPANVSLIKMHHVKNLET